MVAILRTLLRSADEKRFRVSRNRAECKAKD